ncbi:hypothetical protein [Streptomyces sp. NPDC050164]|uniref:hypothetical protein n=1 Tax=Streptomyces sp. NPDC050164 TaxID=3365605 RepID=UPI00378E79BB
MAPAPTRTSAPNSSAAYRPCSRRETSPTPGEAQITRLKAENAKLKDQLAKSEQTIDELTDFRTQALARLAAQHEEIVRLREAALGTSRVSRLPAPRTTVIRNVQLTHPDALGTVGTKVIENGLRTGLRLDRRYGGTPATRVRDHDSERRDKPMIPMITALVSSRGADRV